MPKTAQSLKNKTGFGGRFFKTFGIGKEKNYFIENFSLMLSSDMPIAAALAALKGAIKSKKLFKITEELETEISGGAHFWQAFAKTGLFPDYVISLIRIGEGSGRLSENLKLLSRQQEKDRILKQRIGSAMIYPAIVLILTLVLGTAIAWFILPRLAEVFLNLRLKVPLVTSVLINLGIFLAKWGFIVVPGMLITVFAILYFLFVFSKTKFLGHKLLFALPGVGNLVQEIELSRFGYILGNLLSAGVPILESMELLSQASVFENYRELFHFLKLSLEEGNSFQKSFAAFRGINNLLPVPVQQIIIMGEKSGKLEQIFLNIGKNYEEKSETTAQNLTVIIEPLLLIVVWIGVASVALAVILPLYNLIGGLQDVQTVAPVQNQTVIKKVSSPIAPAKPSVNQASTTPPSSQAASPAIRGVMTQVQSGSFSVLPKVKFVNLRRLPEKASAVLAKIYPGKVYTFTAKQEGWLAVSLNNGVSGWVLSDYVAVLH